MKRIIVFLIGICFIGCQIKENRDRIIEQHRKDSIEQKRKNDSLIQKHIEDSLLISKFRKWIEPTSHDITYIHKFFEKDIEKISSSTIVLKVRPTILNMEIRVIHDKSLANGFTSFLSINRSRTWETNEDTYTYYITSYFKLNITDDNKTTNQIFKEKRDNDIDNNTDEKFLKTIIDNTTKKIQVEEYSARVETGHFEGEKQEPDKLMRKFYLSDENKLAIKESYLLSLILEKK